MKARLAALAATLRRASGHAARGASALGAAARPRLPSLKVMATVAVAAWAAWSLVNEPPMVTVQPGEIGVRTNQLTGGNTAFGPGPLLALPMVHSVRLLPLRDQLYRPGEGAEGRTPFQSVEGLSLGIDLAVRYALDPAQAARVAGTLPLDIDGEVVEPAVQGVVYRIVTRYTVREIFSAKRAEIEAAIAGELKARLAGDGLLLKGVQIGRVELPPEFRQGMDRLLAEELATEKMRYTLELKARQVQQTELEAQADKVRRETEAAAAAREQVIAAQAQEEAMRHVLPFKHKQIEQRQLEAEAEKVARIKAAEAAAQARRIEAAGEADSRRKLAEAEAYRLEQVGLASAQQMGREGVLLSRHPLLIQKTLADKLADKVQVIVAPPGTDGRLLSGLAGAPVAPPAPAADAVAVQPPEPGAARDVPEAR